MLDAVYVNAKKTKSIIAIKPKPPFNPVFQVAASKKDSNIRILNEPLNDSSLVLVETGETLSLVLISVLSSSLSVVSCVI